MVNNKNGDYMKTILITGGAGGIAKSVIDKVCDRYRIIVGVHNEKQRLLVSNRYKGNKNIRVIKLDLLCHDDIVSVSKYDIDILICNAAIGYGGSLMEIDVDKVRENYEVNVFSNILLIQSVLPRMVSKNSGKIIVISSLAGMVSIPFLGSYSSSKAALSRVVHTLKNELKIVCSGVRIYLVLPGMYKTGFNDVMLMNKYDMDLDSYFSFCVDSIRKYESFFWGLLQRKSLDSISRKIIFCIDNDIGFLYSAPVLHRFFVKLYSIIND